MSAAELVCGDLVKLSLGGVVAADVHLTSGSVELDQSMLAGESLLGSAPQYLACTLLGSRCPDHFNSRNLWNRNGAIAHCGHRR